MAAWQMWSRPARRGQGRFWFVLSCFAIDEQDQVRHGDVAIAIAIAIAIATVSRVLVE
jgi:hypothetical protein